MERSFFEIFENLEDPRHEKGKVYPLIDVVILAVYGVLIGFTDFANMSYYLKKREKELKEALALAEGVPSHDVFSDVFRALDVARFMELFVTWTKQLVYAKTGKHIAIDGKAVCAATKKAENGKIPYVVSAFMCVAACQLDKRRLGKRQTRSRRFPNYWT